MQNEDWIEIFLFKSREKDSWGGRQWIYELSINTLQFICPDISPPHLIKSTQSHEIRPWGFYCLHKLYFNEIHKVNIQNLCVSHLFGCFTCAQDVTIAFHYHWLLSIDYEHQVNALCFIRVQIPISFAQLFMKFFKSIRNHSSKLTNYKNH